jgi:hypothetical protein
VDTLEPRTRGIKIDGSQRWWSLLDDGRDLHRDGYTSVMRWRELSSVGIVRCGLSVDGSWVAAPLLTAADLP